jgi:hypothetical protein
MARVDLSPEVWPAEVHSGPEGRPMTVRLTRPEAIHLFDQLWGYDLPCRSGRRVGSFFLDEPDLTQL